MRIGTLCCITCKGYYHVDGNHHDVFSIILESIRFIYIVQGMKNKIAKSICHGKYKSNCYANEKTQM